MKKIKKFIMTSTILTLLLILYTTICAFSYAKTTSKNLSDSVFRLHVLANSDSKEDQDLKYKVRDALINYMNTLCTNITTKEEAIKIANDNLEKFKEIAKNKIKSSGYSYDVDLEIGNFNFPTKNYGDISLPAGFYDALRVKIGKAKGQNWWCVMFPPLCFIDITSGTVPDSSKDLLKENMNEENFALISNNNSNHEINFKFKILELFGKNKYELANKKIK